MVEGDFISSNPSTAYPTEVTSVIEWWVIFFPLLNKLEPFTSLISYLI